LNLNNDRRQITIALTKLKQTIKIERWRHTGQTNVLKIQFANRWKLIGAGRC